MRVLHITSGNLWGGVETLLTTLAAQRNLCLQMEPHFALCFDGKLATQLRASGINPHLLGGVRIRYPWTVWRAQQRIKRLLKKEQFDFAICHLIWPLFIFGEAIKSSGLPLLFWCHDPPKGQHWLERRVKKIRPDFVITNSRYTEAFLPRFYDGIRSETVYCPVPAIDLSCRDKVRQGVREELAVPENRIVIIQVSRLEKFKGQEILLSALGKLQDLDNWTCWFVGGVQRPPEKKYFQQLKDQANKLGIAGRIQFLGHQEDVFRLFIAADIYCQPNTAPEPFGISFVEALYAGLPVVTTEIGGAKEVVDRTCGDLIPPGDPEALSVALSRLIKDSTERRKLSVYGPKRAQALCDPGRQLNKLHAVLSELV